MTQKRLIANRANTAMLNEVRRLIALRCRIIDSSMRVRRDVSLRSTWQRITLSAMSCWPQGSISQHTNEESWLPRRDFGAMFRCTQQGASLTSSSDGEFADLSPLPLRRERGGAHD